MSTTNISCLCPAVSASEQDGPQFATSDEAVEPGGHVGLRKLSKVHSLEARTFQDSGLYSVRIKIAVARFVVAASIGPPHSLAQCSLVLQVAAFHMQTVAWDLVDGASHVVYW